VCIVLIVRGPASAAELPVGVDLGSSKQRPRAVVCIVSLRAIKAIKSRNKVWPKIKRRGPHVFTAFREKSNLDCVSSATPSDHYVCFFTVRTCRKNVETYAIIHFPAMLMAQLKSNFAQGDFVIRERNTLCVRNNSVNYYTKE